MITLHTYERHGKWFWQLKKGKDVLCSGLGDSDAAGYAMCALQNIRPPLVAKVDAK